MQLCWLALVLVVFLWQRTSCKETGDVLVRVEQGTLRGSTATTVYNTTYTKFLGVPYARPPVGDLRFQAPLPASGWEGVRDATRYGSDCAQLTGVGSEDCLYLNVFVPGEPHQGADLPVFFWLYGGAYLVGSGSDQQHGPDFLASHDIILVTINYRLGALGFLSTGDAVVPGNAALKDQRLALSWVQRNIASFGGDPRRVTLAGQSAGGSCVSLHMVSPGSAGLFSRAIIESSNFISVPVTEREAARQHAFNLGAALGFQAENSRELVDFLRSVNATDLLVARSLILTEKEKPLFIVAAWGPSIEANQEGAFISEAPIGALTEGRFSRVPVLSGVTSGETGVYILNQSALITGLDTAFEQVVGPCLHLSTARQQTLAARKLRQFYFGNETISGSNPDPLVTFTIDIAAVESIDALVREVAKNSNQPVYYYEFDFRGENVNKTQWGVTHNGELPFLFLWKDLNYNLDPNSEEERVRRNILRLWTNFAKHGNPTPQADPVVWEPYDLRRRSYLLMQANFTLAHNKDAERMDFWNKNVPLMPFPGTFRDRR